MSLAYSSHPTELITKPESDAPLAVFVMGPPGVGKTAICAELATDPAVHAFHAGQLLRRVAAEAATPEERRAAAHLLHRGTPIPVPLYRRLITGFRAADCSLLLFDGYPRDPIQFLAIPGLLAAAGTPDATVLGMYLSAPARTVERRRTGRRVCSRCGRLWSPAGCCPGGQPTRRADDTDAGTVAKRQQLVDRHAALLLRRFRRCWTGITVTSVEPVESLAAAVRKELRQYTGVRQRAGIR